MKLSFKVDGSISANGSLSIIIKTFPCSKYLIAVYGFSALIMLGNKFLFSFSIKFLIVPDAMIPSILIFFALIVIILSSELYL